MCLDLRVVWLIVGSSDGMICTSGVGREDCFGTGGGLLSMVSVVAIHDLGEIKCEPEVF